MMDRARAAILSSGKADRRVARKQSAPQLASPEELADLASILHAA
jgi:hypothetical protein